MIGHGNIKIGLFIEPNAKPVPNLDDELIIRKISFLVDGDKFVDTINELKNKGVSIVKTEDTGIAYSVFINDPDGYLLEFTMFHGNGPLQAYLKPTKVVSVSWAPKMRQLANPTSPIRALLRI
jgi:hypothetical protein